MKGKKLLFAVNLTLIVCLVLSPMAVFAQDEAPIPPPAEISVEAPAEESGGEAVTDAPAVEAPAQAAEPVTEIQTVTTVEEPAPAAESTAEGQTEAEQPAVINEEVHESEDSVTTPETNTEEEEEEEENKTVEETPAEETVAETVETEKAEETEETDSSEQVDETAALSNSMDAAPTDSEEIELDLSKGNVTINDSGDDDTGRIKITGTDANGTSINTSAANNSIIRVKQTGESAISQVIKVILSKAQSFVNLILDSLNIKNSSKASIEIKTAAESTVALELDGKNTVKTDASDYAALQKSGDGTLVIQNENDTDGSLYAQQLTGGVAAAIGGGRYDNNVGTIVISGAKVEAVSKKMSGDGAAIGAGYEGSVKEIRIENNADVTATSSGAGAAIGASNNGSAGSIIISNSTVNATNDGYGAAIGGGKDEKGKVDTITIENNSIVTATGKGYGAGIGAGYEGSVGTITIDNSEVHAYGDGWSARGAGIGAGQYGSVETIVIKNESNVEAEGDYYAAAIGAGQGDSSDATKGTVGTITISDSTVNATSNGNGAAIGGGNYSTVGSITIDNSTVTAKQTGDPNANAIGGGTGDSSRVDSITIKGESTIYATGNSDAVKGDVDTSGLEGAVIIDDEWEYYTKKVTPEPTPEPTPTPVPVIVIDPPKDENTDEEPGPAAPVVPVAPKPETPVDEEEDALVESKKDDDVVHSKIEIEDTTAKITVTDETGEQIEPKEVTIKSVAKFEETGAAEAAIQLTQKLIVNVDIETMKEVTEQNGTDDDAVTVTNLDSVITVKSGETALVSVDVKEVIAAVEETVTVKFNRNTVRVICGASAYHIDLTDLGDVGTLTLRLENGVLKIYDKNGNLLREIASA